MTTHNIAITYPPKVEPVHQGVIRQTIRPYNPAKPKRVGDIANLFTWAGKPYRSPWAWRMREEIIQTIDFRAATQGIAIFDAEHRDHPCFYRLMQHDWESDLATKWAELDGIVPATGLELRNVLTAFHPRVMDEGLRMQVIRW